MSEYEGRAVHVYPVSHGTIGVGDDRTGNKEVRYDAPEELAEYIARLPAPSHVTVSRALGRQAKIIDALLAARGLTVFAVD